jgi:hypothetical protein
VVGTRDLGDARFDFAGTYLTWMDHWLNGGTGHPSMPRSRTT